MVPGPDIRLRAKYQYRVLGLGFSSLDWGNDHIRNTDYVVCMMNVWADYVQSGVEEDGSTRAKTF